MITIKDPHGIGGTITVQIAGLLPSGGDITLTASNHFQASASWLPIPAWDTAAVRIDVNGATIRGRDIVLRADADNDTAFDGEVSKLEEALESIFDFVGSFRVLVGIAKSKSTAEIYVGAGTDLRSDADVVVEAHANSEANVFTIGIGAGGTYARSEAVAKVTVADRAQIRAAADVRLLSSTQNAVSVAGIDLLLGKVLPAHVVFALTEAYSHATTLVASAAHITAGRHVAISAFNTKNLSSTVMCGGDDHYLGVGVLVALSDATADAIVHGTVTAGNGDVSVIAHVNTAKNINVVQSVHGDSLFGMATSYISNLTPMKAAKDIVKSVGKWALGGLVSWIGQLWSSSASGPAPQTASDPKSWEVSAAVAYGQHRDAATAKLGSAAVVTAGGKVQVEATVTDRPDISAISIVAGNRNPDGKSLQRTIGKERVFSAAILAGWFTNESYATIESGATVDAGAAVSVNAHTVLPYQAVWTTLRQIGTDYRNLAAAVATADLSLNSFVSSWAFSAAEGAKGTADSVSLVWFDNTSEALIEEQARVNQHVDAAVADVDVTATTDLAVVNLVGNYTQMIKQLHVDAKDGRRSEAKGARGGAGASFGGFLLTHTTTAAIESQALVSARNLNVDAKTITKNVVLGVAGSEVSETSGIFSFIPSGAITAVCVNDHTLAKIDDGAVVTAEGTVDVTAHDDLLNVNLVGGVVVGESRGWGMTVGANVVRRDTRAIIGNRETVLGRGEFAPNTGVDDVENTIDVGYAHGWTTGDAVLYSNGGGNSIGGLVDGDTYYVRVVDARTLAVARSPQEAALDAAPRFSPDDVDDRDDAERIDLGYEHGFQNGDAVVYDNGGGESIGGLASGKTYYVIRVSGTVIQLAATREEARTDAHRPASTSIQGPVARARHTVFDSIWIRPTAAVRPTPWGVRLTPRRASPGTE